MADSSSLLITSSSSWWLNMIDKVPIPFYAPFYSWTPPAFSFRWFYVVKRFEWRIQPIQRHTALEAQKLYVKTEPYTLDDSQSACAQAESLFLQVFSTNRIGCGIGTAGDPESELEIEAMKEYWRFCSCINTLDRIFQYEQ